VLRHLPSRRRTRSLTLPTIFARVRRGQCREMDISCSNARLEGRDVGTPESGKAEIRVFWRFRLDGRCSWAWQEPDSRGMVGELVRFGIYPNYNRVCGTRGRECRLCLFVCSLALALHRNLSMCISSHQRLQQSRWSRNVHTPLSAAGRSPRPLMCFRTSFWGTSLGIYFWQRARSIP